MKANQKLLNSWQGSIGVVIPCYKVTRHILGVLESIGPEVSRIYVVDDCCPEDSGNFVEANCSDRRVRVIRNEKNEGVGGAVMHGYRVAIADGMDVIVKIDGDGQMDPSLLPAFVAPIIEGQADYTKGNRFFDLEQIHAMPKLRIFGNAMLSLLAKVSSGYWSIFDPTNGYTAIHREVASHLPFEKISKRYFFETDVLFRLNTFSAVVVDVPMDAKYGDEISNLKISKILGEFLLKHARNFGKRLFYTYYLRGMSVASLELPLGIFLFTSGALYGIFHWWQSWVHGTVTPAGTVMLSAMPVIVGIQFILAFVGYDVANAPKRPFQRGSTNKECG